MKIALLTCPEIPLGTSDDQRLIPTLKERGFEPSFINWKDLNKSFDIALIRSPWNYTQCYEQFLSVLKSFKGTIINGVELIEWNGHKSYLKELGLKGLPIIPMMDIAEYDFRWEKAVFKPYVSASSWRTKIIGSEFDKEIKSWLKETSTPHAREYFIQPYCETVTQTGEYSLIYFNSGSTIRFSHCCQKLPKLNDFRVQEEFGGSILPADAPTGLRELGDKFLQAVPYQNWVYGRLDFIMYGGEWCLGEMEFIEPDLYLRTKTSAAADFVDQLSKYLA